jgi:MFS family permease
MLGGLTALLTLGSGIFFNGFGGFFKPLAAGFGWSRAETSLAFALSRLEGGLEGPLAGWLIDRLGPRRLIVFGVTSVGLGYILLSQIDSLWMFYTVYGGFLSIGFNTGFFSPCQTATVTWFRRRRGAAVGLAGYIGQRQSSVTV